jgi:hypothetical protein
MGVGPLGMAQPQAGLVKPMPQGKAAAAADDEDEE